MFSYYALFKKWDGCSMETQRKFKTFYAFSQFLATMACLTVTNPLWPLLVLMPIQLASLLMTLVRKGLLTSQGYHRAYSLCLVMPYLAATRSLGRSMEFPISFIVASALFAIRRRGINKYVLWLSVSLARIAFGEYFFSSEFY